MWPRTGDPVLSEGTAPTSVVIRAGTFSHFSHAEVLYIPDQYPRGPISKWEVVSAEASGTKRMSFAKYNNARARILRVPKLDDAGAYRVYMHAAALARKKAPYNFLGLGWTGMVYWARLAAILRFNPGLLLAHEIAKRLPVPKTRGSFFCSMEVQDCYMKEGVKFVNHNGICTPEDIYRSGETKEIAVVDHGKLTLEA